jgi:tagatose 6-phosphate kinase
MILIVNLNLAIDEIVRVDGLTLGGVHRSGRARRQAGGKGVNVARVLKALNERAVLTGFLGGRAGEFIKSELHREKIPFACTGIEGESRTCIILDDASTRAQTVINEAGPEIKADELNEFTDNYRRLLSTSDLVVITGSLSADTRHDVYAGLIQAAHASGRRVLLDTSSEPLRAGLGARPFLVKINQAEAGALLQFPVNDMDSAAEAARRLKAAGAENSMITLGRAGAVLNFASAEYRVTAPRVEARNSVGSGDAVMAGLAAGLRSGLAAEEMAGLGVAAGAANALRGAGRVRAEEILRLKSGVKISRGGL